MVVGTEGWTLKAKQIRNVVLPPYATYQLEREKN